MEILDFSNITTTDILNEVKQWRKESDIDLINRLEGMENGHYELFTENFYIHFNYYEERDGGVISEVLTVIDLECTGYKFSSQEEYTLEAIVFQQV